LRAGCSDRLMQPIEGLPAAIVHDATVRSIHTPLIFSNIEVRDSLDRRARQATFPCIEAVLHRRFARTMEWSVGADKDITGYGAPSASTRVTVWPS
jgi:hypothetical protein